MTKAIILLAFSAAALSGCVQKSGDLSANATNTTSYQPAPIAAQQDVSRKEATTGSGSGNGSGYGSGDGGGGGGTLDQTVTTQVTLNQVETSRTPAAAVTERKIVRHADLQLESDAPEQAQQKITAIAESKNGFVVESQQSSSDVRSGTRDVVTMTVRVPAEKFGETLDELRKTANRTIVETVKSDDVTEEFIDIEAQLKAKKSLEEQFLEIMKRADTVEEALGVQRQLASVRGEIEKIEGRRRFLENQATLSTIKIRLQTPTAMAANSESFGYRLKESFGSGFDAALNFILGLVSFAIAVLPFLIFIVLPIYLIVRYILKKRRKQATPSQIAKDEL